MKTMEELVTVVDNSNYKSTYAEKCPYEARVIERHGDMLIVTSLITGQKYELYSHQVKTNN